MPTVKFDEKEVRMMIGVALATGHSISSVQNAIIEVVSPTQRDKDGKMIPESSKLACMLNMLKTSGYMS